MDARIRYTLSAIQKEFLTLLETQPLEKITVKGICEKAEINRATFYRYYENPKDLLVKLEEERLNILQEKIRTTKTEELQDIFKVIMTDIMENTKLYQILFSENGDRTFRDKIFESCRSYAMGIIEDLFPSFTSNQKEYLYFFIAEGCNGILNRWLHFNMADPVSEVTKFAEAIVVSINASLNSVK